MASDFLLFGKTTVRRVELCHIYCWMLWKEFLPCGNTFQTSILKIFELLNIYLTGRELSNFRLWLIQWPDKGRVPKKNKFWNIIVWFSGLFWLNCEKKIFLHILLLLWIRNRYFLKMFTFVLHNSLKISVFLEIKLLFQKHYYILLCLKFSFMDVK